MFWIELILVPIAATMVSLGLFGLYTFFFEKSRCYVLEHRVDPDLKDRRTSGIWLLLREEYGVKTFWYSVPPNKAYPGIRNVEFLSRYDLRYTIR